MKGTHCKSGRHEFTLENTYIKKSGSRHCIPCHAEKVIEYNKNRHIIRRVKRIVDNNPRISRFSLWRASELKRLKQSIWSCYRAEIRTAKTGIPVRGETDINRVEGRRLSA